MPRLVKLATVLGKVEVTEGIDVSPAAADGFFGLVTPPVVQQNFFRTEVMTGAGSLLPGVTGHRRWEAQVDQLLRGAGAAYSASVKPKADALLRACGFAAAGSFGAGVESYAYTLRSSGFESFSIYEYLNGVRHKFLGARALPRFRCPLGLPARLEAALRALWDDPADAANVAPTGEPTIGYPVLLASSFKIGTQNFAAKHGEVGLDIGRTITPREDATAANGYAGMEMLPTRAPVLTFEAEATTEAGFPFWANLKAGTQMACSWQVGTTQYNRVKFNAPVTQFERLEHGDRGGIITYRATCLLVSPTGVDDELTITFD